MDNKYYGVASTPMDDFLAHYGIKGMKWGVRKALKSGNDRALRRQRIKAEKKLAKLEKLASNGKKYAKRAAAYGAGAAGAGLLSAMGPGGISYTISRADKAATNAMKGIGNVAESVGRGLLDSRKGGKVGSALMTAGRNLRNAGNYREKVSKINYGGNGRNALSKAISDWGTSSSIANSIRDSISRPGGNGRANVTIGSSVRKRLDGVSNSTLARIGAGAVGVGLGAAAARNAYRAATTKKHAAQAKQFRAEMNKAFAGTKYANGVTSTKKRRKNNG